MMKVSYSSSALEDLRSCVEYYSEKSSVIAGAFLQEIDTAVELISESPQMGSPLKGGNRRLILRRFPYFLIYRIEAERAFILAIGNILVSGRIANDYRSLTWVLPA